MSYDRSVMVAVQAMRDLGTPSMAPVAIEGGAVIANGESLSGAVEINGDLVGLKLPAAWTTGALTFQGSVDGENFYDIYDAATERTIASGAIVADRFLAVKKEDWAAFSHIKIRSGTQASPVAQGAARTFVVVVAP